MYLSSVKEDGWDAFKDDTDFLIIAGGDGTVRRVAKALMKRKRLEKQYPLGAASSWYCQQHCGALQISGEASEIIQKWHHNHLQTFDIGKVNGIREDLFFLESFGYGIFPRLMKVMSKISDEIGESVEEKLKAARAVLYDIVLNYEARPCTIIADGADHSGEYIMVEVMNIRSLGPNLVLAPNADPGDGYLDLVMVSEAHRKKFESFLLSEINGEEKQEFNFTTVRAKNLKIVWEGKDLHADDERLKVEGTVEVNIEILRDMMQFMITDEQ
jgi:diacylglycerol kinase (ATP)